MASLLAKSSLPLWIWIIIIVVGSLFVLSMVALVIRLILQRQRRATFIETFGDENLPQRKLTVRRGRVVASSNHLSLTGSKFGFNTFHNEGNSRHSKLTSRSKSPFDWLNTFSRSHSRNSQTTQTTHDTASVIGSYTSPSRHRIYQRSDAGHSNLSFTSTSKDDDMLSIMTDSQPASPTIAVRKPPNFSRSFSKKYHGQDFPSRQHTLSRIEESSPHVSMISSRHARNLSSASHRRDASTATPSPLPYSSSPVIPEEFAIHQRGRSEQIFSTSTPTHNEMLEVPSRSLDLTDMRRIHHNSTSNFDIPDPRRVSAVSSRYSLSESINQPSSRPQQSHITALPVTLDPNSLQYWSTRSDLRPVRSSSKKGNVLRKKSLSRSEMVARFEL